MAQFLRVSFLKQLPVNALCFIMLVVPYWGCKSTKTISKPEESYTAVNYKPTESFIYLPIAIKQEVLINKINKQLTGLLYEDNNLEDDNLMLKVWKRDNINISLSGTTIDYRVPLKVWLRTGITKWGFTLAQEMEIELALKYRTVFAIQPDWTMNCATVPMGYEWLSDPYIDVKGIKIPVKTLAGSVIDNSQDKLCKVIDEQAKQYINIKQYVQQAWAQLQRPILLNPNYHVWLKLTPTEVNVTPFVSERGIVSTSVGVQAVSEVFISANEPLANGLSTLPAFKMRPKVPNELRLNIDIDLPYTEAEQIATATLVGKSFEDGSRKVTVKEIKLYGSNGQVVVNVLLEGSFNGRVYLTGLPVYNVTKKAIEISNLGFAIDTRNVLLKSASWLFKSNIVKKVAENAVFPIGDYLLNAQTTANSSLNNNTALKNIVLNGQLSKIDISSILLTPKSFKITGITEGKMIVSIENLEF